MEAEELNDSDDEILTSKAGKALVQTKLSGIKFFKCEKLKRQGQMHVGIKLCGTTFLRKEYFDLSFFSSLI